MTAAACVGSSNSARTITEPGETGPPTCTWSSGSVRSSSSGTTSPTVAVAGRLRTMPIAPSSPCSATSTTVRRKFGSSRTGEAMRSCPASDSIQGHCYRPGPRRTLQRQMTRLHVEVQHDGVADAVAVEEPLEIRVDGAPLAVTMRTPGHDEELALGFLVGEGLLDRGAPAPAAGLTEDLAGNVIEVAGPLAREPGTRRFYTTSSCGVCGKGALEEVAVHAPRQDPRAGPRLTRELLAALPGRLRQPGFERTGGLHATGLFTAGGELVRVREDVG